MSFQKRRTWFITGISSGLGRALAIEAISRGDFVLGTMRSDGQIKAFNKQYGHKALTIKLDVTNPKDIQRASNLIKTRVKRLDVLVNNAGYGFAGAIEETSIDEVRDVFEANFFGTMAVTKAFLPLFREQGHGNIIQISSHGGIKAFPGFGVYNASKFALEGMSEALAQEIKPLGINLTIVQPGPFRTKFAGRGFKMASESIADYETTAGKFRTMIKSVDGKQEGDPEKAARAIIDISRLENPPLRLVLGKIALGTVASKLESVQKDLDEYREVSESVVFE